MVMPVTYTLSDYTNEREKLSNIEHDLSPNHFVSLPHNRCGYVYNLNPRNNNEATDLLEYVVVRSKYHLINLTMPNEHMDVSKQEIAFI